MASSRGAREVDVAAEKAFALVRVVLLDVGDVDVEILRGAAKFFCGQFDDGCWAVDVSDRFFHGPWTVSVIAGKVESLFGKKNSDCTPIYNRKSIFR